ncbi:MAG: transglutaminase family protein [Rhodoferax sp.]|uniref:transglutaminase family protein n=1 Tax=Rhodoferax sp. TaxID=50421 RepID=UPI0032663BB3
MPVILEVEHVTTYRYAKEVEFGLHRVAFHPRAAHDIRVLYADLTVSPHSRQHWIHDVFSNSVMVVEPLVPASTLVFTARFAIEHMGVKNHELPISPEAQNYPFEYSADDKQNLSRYLALQYPDDAAVVRSWVASFLPQRGTIHTRDVLANINQFIRTDFVYAARDAMGTQSPAQTLALRSGTCRDFALLMMEAVRGLGMAARFVSGYIYDPALDADNFGPGAVVGSSIKSADIGGGTLGSGATHAWLNVYLPGAGWIPFDPTNTISGGTDLIRVAFTRTPEQAAPVSGGWTGDASDFLGMDVSVRVSRRLPDAAGISAPG